MSLKKASLSLNPLWKNPACFSTQALSSDIASWLLYKGSFTRKASLLAQGKSEGIRIQVLKEALEKAKLSHCETSAFDCQFLYTREVLIYLGADLLMYARSVMPKDASVIFKRLFRGLGARPLGEMLFNNQAIQRGPFEVAKILPSESYYEWAVSAQSTRPSYVWARRSPFFMVNKFLLLTEVFSPQLIRLIKNYENR